MANPILAAAAACCAAFLSPLAPAQSPLTTLFAANNGGSPGGAVYFTIQAFTAVELTQIDVNTNATGSVSLELYLSCLSTWRSPYHQGASNWTLIGTGAGPAAGLDQPTPCPLNAPVHLLPGSYRAAIVLPGASHRYTNGSLGTTTTYGNGDLELELGGASNVPFVGSQFFPRIWNGAVHYTTSPTTPAVVAPSCGGRAAITSYGETGSHSSGLDLVLDSSEPLLGSSLELRIAADPSAGLGVLTCGFRRGSTPLQNLLLQTDLTVATFTLPTSPAGTTTHAVALPPDPTFAGVPLRWQAFAADAGLAPLPAAYSNGLETVLGTHPAGAEVGLEFGEDVDLQAFVPCPNNQKRYRVRGWRRNNVGPGVQTVRVYYLNNLLCDGTVAPGCLVGKLWTTRFVGCLPAPPLPDIDLWYRDCEQQPVVVGIPAANIAILGCPGGPQRLPAAGNLALPPLVSGRWESSRPSVATIDQTGAWVGVGPGKTKMTYSGYALIDGRLVHVATSCWIRLTP